MLRRILFGGGFVIILFIVGFIFLLRSCLAKYDERSMISSPLIFQKDSKAVIFSLVKFDKTTSYSQNGGMISKSVSTTYSIQTNDLFTGEKIQEKKVKSHSSIKTYPVEIMGASSGKAWVFAGEPMAFDPFTLEKLADIKMMEAKNPALAGKFSNERKYYELDTLNKVIYTTLKDGTIYKINTETITATVLNDGEPDVDPYKAAKRSQEAALKHIGDMSDSIYSHYREASRKYSTRSMDAAGFKKAIEIFGKERSLLDKMRDSIYALQRESSDESNAVSELNNRIRSLQSGNTSFSSMQVNADTISRQWYGLYKPEELDDIIQNFDYRTSYADAARNKLYKAAVYPTDSTKKYSSWKIAEEKNGLGNDFYLEGGFLLNRQTAIPYHLTDPGGFLIVHKAEIGHDAQILLTRIDMNGKKSWTINTGLKEIPFWNISGNQMIIIGVDNKELSSGENNLLHTINLSTGKFYSHDFFNGKMRN